MRGGEPRREQVGWVAARARARTHCKDNPKIKFLSSMDVEIGA